MTSAVCAQKLSAASLLLPTSANSKDTPWQQPQLEKIPGPMMPIQKSCTLQL